MKIETLEHAGAAAAAADDCKVLHCAETIKGGIASYLRELLTLQARDFGGHTIAVVVPRSQVNELVVPRNITVGVFDDSGGRVRNALVLAQHVRRLTDRLRPRNVHVHGTFAGVTARLALLPKRQHSKLIYCAHGWAWDRPLKPAKRQAVVWIERTLAKLADDVVCISAHDANGALRAGIDAKRVRCVLNGIANTAFADEGSSGVSWPQGTTRLLFIGRFDRQKGVDVFCNALRLLGAQASAVLVGAPVLGDSQTLNVPANATAVGWIDSYRLHQLLAEADVVVVPSRWEGFGLVAVEAMRAGKPVLAARVGGLPEVVDDGVTGFLVAPENPQQIAEIVRNTPHATWQRMGVAGRARFAQHFTAERMHREIAALYA